MARLFLILFFCFNVVFNYAQSLKHYDIAEGDEHFEHRNYLMALPIYKENLRREKDNILLNYRIAECYLNTNINKSEAVKYLEFCVKSPKANSQMYLRLGEAYRLSYKLDDAIKAFEKYKELEPKQKNNADRQIEICRNAKTLMANPVNISFTNLGKGINTEWDDYYPFIAQDEQFLAFTSRRKALPNSKVETDGYYSSDIYTSNLENGKWLDAVNIGPKINSKLDEIIIGLKSDGSEMLVYIDHIDKFGDIYTSVKKNGAYPKYTPFPEFINKKFEKTASISGDGNTLVFTRAEDLQAQSDLFICRKLPSGEWSTPFKIGDEINTIYDEDFPYLSDDGLTLYFISKGHNTMGGYDLFKSYWNSNDLKWSKAENLGYPLNTTDDDKSISLTNDCRVGYISASRPGGFGNHDIYRVRFNDHEQRLTLFLGQIVLGDSLNKPKEFIANVLAVNNITDEEFSFAPNPRNGKLVMSLPVGIYDVTVTSEGYKELKDKITVSDIGAILTEEKKSYKLLKK